MLFRSVVALAAAISIAAGAGALRFGSEVGSAYFRQLTSIRRPADVMKALSVARGAFIVAGGATNVADSGTETSGGVSATRDKDSVEGFAEAMAIGVATMFVPLTLLQALSIVHVSGGGAMRLRGRWRGAGRLHVDERFHAENGAHQPRAGWRRRLV